MKETERQIQVRTLTGKSITINVSPTKTIRDLKRLLRQHQFPPAASSDFHLFLRGMKLGLQIQIGSYSFNSGEFVALVPFTKKGKSQNLQAQESQAASQNSQPWGPSGLAESTWRDAMEDLSYLTETPQCEKQPGSLRSDFCDGKPNCDRKRRRTDADGQDGLSEDLISDILQSSGKHFLDKEVCKKFLSILDSVHCFAGVKNESCVLLSKAAFPDSNKPSSSCICPPLLKKLMRAFTFLNILAGFLQMQNETVTLHYVKDFLDKLHELGFGASVDDLKRLSALFPKVVSFVDHESENKPWHDVIVVINLSKDADKAKSIPITARKRLSVSKIVSSVKKRQVLFKRNLEDALSLLSGEGKGNLESVASLEEQIMSLKKKEPLSCENEASQAKSSSENKKAPVIKERCHEMHPLSPMLMLEHLKEGMGSKGQIVHVEEINARVADFMAIPDEFSESAKSALSSLEITKLYRHQAESIKASLCHRNVVVSTMTSSGKSLCYNLPVLEALSQDLQSCAIYLFPTKALAQDQLRALHTMTERFEHFNIGVYDGDTSQAERTWLRANARLLISNPDMLHMSILPFHRQFERILANLKFLVIDEAHAYKGAFGSHTALILRRLRRICSHVYGSDPSFVLSTATSANPREHAMELANLESVELIDKDGSPSGPKLFVLWNPLLLPKTVPKSATGDKTVVMKRSSPIVEVSCLFAEMVQHGLRSIAFCKTRKLCELVLSYTREILQDTAPHLVNSIGSYRGGFVAEDRRRIESEFFSGKLCGIAATNALELGIDVGHIDVTLHLGFPGSVSSLWQQAGRSGRRGRPSLAVYIAFEGPLDQYYMKFPQKLFQSPVECCHVDTQNPKVLEQHLICAALEHPLNTVYDEKYFGSGLNSAIAALESRGYLLSNHSCDSTGIIWNYIGQEKSPSRGMSIRAIEPDKHKVIDRQSNELLEEIEESRAFFLVYEGAVYMNQGNTYLVQELDLLRKTAFCQKADLKYYTKTRDYTDIDVIGGALAYPGRAHNYHLSGTTAQTNSCKVTTTWFGFYRIEKRSGIVLDTVDLVLPKYSYESQAVWIRVPQSVKTLVEEANFSFRGGLLAASHAVLNAVPLYMICDTSDLAPECANPHETRYVPERILLYDQHPGGTGHSLRLQPLFPNLLTAALDMLISCRCSGETGCPSCAHSLVCQEYNELLHKDAAMMIIKGVLEEEKFYFRGSELS